MQHKNILQFKKAVKKLLCLLNTFYLNQTILETAFLSRAIMYLSFSLLQIHHEIFLQTL